MILIRAGQALGLLFLIGPVSDLVSSSDAPARKAVIAVVLAAFVALYLAVWPVARPLRQRGANATRTALLLLAALGALTLALGAPGSFALLFWYVVAAAGLALPAGEALAVTGVTAAAVAAGLAAAGSDGSTVAAYTSRSSPLAPSWPLSAARPGRTGSPRGARGARAARRLRRTVTHRPRPA
jgi:hypothetical protein